MSKFYLISPLILQTLIWPITRPLLLFFGHLKIIGSENLNGVDRSKGVIFAVNHSNELDPILIPACLPFLSAFMPMFYTSRERAFYKNSGWLQRFYGGWFFKIWGAHPVNSGKKNYEISLSNHVEILKYGKSICVFPEGKKTLDGSLQKGRGGVAYISDKVGSVIIPVCISNIFKMSIKDFFSRRRNIVVSFGKPLYRKDIFATNKIFSIDDYKIGTAVVMSKIAELKNRASYLSNMPVESPFVEKGKIKVGKTKSAEALLNK
ncbi:MAG: lysophospholipid acyltransferase family protein [Candidatus Paceibacterota bacterium]|jgi:1-acyl-sn-glycerol-3-phosphate acyltransferase